MHTLLCQTQTTFLKWENTFLLLWGRPGNLCRSRVTRRRRFSRKTTEEARSGNSSNAKEIRMTAQQTSNPTSTCFCLRLSLRGEFATKTTRRLSCSLAGMQALRCREKAARREPQALWRRGQLSSLSRDHHMGEIWPETTPVLKRWPRNRFVKTQNMLTAWQHCPLL